MNVYARHTLNVALSGWALLLVIITYWLGGKFLVFLPSIGEIAAEAASILFKRGNLCGLADHRTAGGN